MPVTLAEASRVLRSGGTLIMSSAYVKDIAYGQGGKLQWGRLVLKAQKKARAKGFSPQAPMELMNFTQADYTEQLRLLQFSGIEVLVKEARMEVDDVAAICQYDEFARGALPGVPVDDAKDALIASAEELFGDMRNRHPGTAPYFPRGWMILSAKK